MSGGCGSIGRPQNNCEKPPKMTSTILIVKTAFTISLKFLSEGFSVNFEMEIISRQGAISMEKKINKRQHNSELGSFPADNSFPIAETEGGTGPNSLALSLQVHDKEEEKSTSHSPEQVGKPTCRALRSG